MRKYACVSDWLLNKIWSPLLCLLNRGRLFFEVVGPRPSMNYDFIPTTNLRSNVVKNFMTDCQVKLLKNRIVFDLYILGKKMESDRVELKFKAQVRIHTSLFVTNRTASENRCDGMQRIDGTKIDNVLIFWQSNPSRKDHWTTLDLRNRVRQLTLP